MTAFYYYKYLESMLATKKSVCSGVDERAESKVIIEACK